jgi:ribosomal protein S1
VPPDESFINDTSHQSEDDGSYWERIRELLDNEELFYVTVIGFNQGGALVNGREVSGFIPSSHLMSLPPGIHPKQKRCLLERLIGKRLSARVIGWDLNKIASFFRNALRNPRMAIASVF